jgi:diguanylate cyclase
VSLVAERAPADGRGVVEKVLRLVQERTGFALVMATRVLDDDWRVLAATGNPYAVEAGDTFRWSDSICSRMVGTDRAAPWTVLDVDADLVACSAPVRTLLPIASYLGAPLVGADGSVLGTLCAIDPDAVDQPFDAGLVVFAAELVSWALECAAGSAASERAAERTLLRVDQEAAVVIDRRQWDQLLDAEIERTRWSGETLSVAMARVAGGAGTRTALADLAGRVAATLGRDDAVAVLGSNRLGIASVAPSSLSETLTRTAGALRDGDGDLQWVVARTSGADSAAAIERELDVRLVGAAPATARAASSLLTYTFCTSCGRKGAYAMRDGRGVRCKYCQALALAEPDPVPRELPA